ncbi:RagB/SusD family nutrient uptake outer membrane protein [Sphingobacterium tabacisoli]|uniref:RagB/SusD family nutrient uptake outer membrane protein n=1 Tax=Sphingobacterium tabacisoli TaxID=2044855 RepID=A0ABW5KWJ9_9SPHI|nr:RagB/SusD family nutrient uptake outer membrane protein [Sphingobacterium tabacisoli]
MKLLQYSIMLLAVATTACKQDFLQRTPQTNVTDETFLQNPTDLETYTNGLYSQIKANYTDLLSDNIALSNNDQNADVRTLLTGTLSPATVGGWNKSTWEPLRNINFMLGKASKIQGDPAVINHYIGVARFLRANFYYTMVKRYGDAPWYSTVVGTSDEALLYKAKDPRILVVDSVMADLEFAARHIQPSRTDNTYVTKWSALTLLSRVALHEGTFRKYHTELKLETTANAFLERAASASAEVISQGGFQIEGNSVNDFIKLFSSNNLSSNKEIIFLQRNDKNLAVANNTHTVLDWQWALSSSLMDEFLMADGTSFTDLKDYDKKEFVQVFENRDPRLAATIMPPGFKTSENGNPYVTRPDFGGYLQIKFYPRDPALRGGWVLNYTDLPIMRYAEVLLNNAEAKAELGTLTQADLDNTINKLRTRVGMPALLMTESNAKPDNYLSTRHPHVTGNNKGVILEIRRERRVELACEGFRFDDLYRWKDGALLAKNPEGFYISGLGAIDVTGDGTPDIAILKDGDETPLSGLSPSIKEKIVKFNINSGNFYLSKETSGRIMFNDDKANQRPRSFDEKKYYYFPIPLEQTILNPNLKQPEGWQ